jgi:hypothetical protein
MNIQGKVVKGKESVYAAKVFISDSTGKLLDTKMAALTDSDGKYSILAPSIIENGVEVLDTTKFVTMTNYFPSAKATKPLVKGQSTYDFDLDFAGREQQIQEVTVTATRSKPKEVKQDTKSIKTGDKKKSYIWVIPIVVGVLTIGGILLYRKYKKK